MAPSSPYLQRLPPGRSRNLECVSKLVFGGSCRRTAPPGARRNALVTAHASAPGGAPRPAPPARRVLKRSLAVGVLLDATGVPLPGTRFQQFVVVGFAVIFYMLSKSTAPTNRITAAAFGKMPTTFRPPLGPYRSAISTCAYCAVAVHVPSGSLRKAKTSSALPVQGISRKRQLTLVCRSAHRSHAANAFLEVARETAAREER